MDFVELRPLQSYTEYTKLVLDQANGCDDQKEISATMGYDEGGEEDGEAY